MFKQVLIENGKTSIRDSVTADLINILFSAWGLHEKGSRTKILISTCALDSQQK